MEAELAQGAEAAEMALLRMLLKRVLASFPYVYIHHWNHPIVHKFYSMLDVELLLPDSQHAGCDVHQEGKV